MNTRRIGLRSLFFYMLRRLWIILLAAVCGGALLAGYKYYKDKKSAGTSTAVVGVNDGSTLSDAERADVENASLQYRYYLEAKKYLEESPLMVGSPADVKQYVAEYRVLLKTPEALPAYGTVETTYTQLIRAYIDDGLFIRDLVEKDTAYEGFLYFKELVNTGNNALGEFTLKVNWYEPYPNLAEDVKALLEAYMKELMAQESGLSFTLMKEGEVEAYNITSDSTQRGSINNLISYRKNYMSYYNSFTSAQEGYFQYLTGQGEAEAAETAKTTTAKKVKINKTYIIVGILIGGFGGICFCILLLYLSLSHASPADYGENAGLRSFGMLFLKNEKPKKLKSFLLRKELKGSTFDSNEESIAYSAVRIGNYCRTHDIRELAVLSSRSSSAVEKGREAMEKALKKQDVRILSGEKVVKDSKALTELLQVKCCIFLEQLHGGNRQKLGELIRFCRENEVQVIGSLGVAEADLEAGSRDPA